MRQFGWAAEEVYLVADRAHALAGQGRLREAALLFEGLVVVDPGHDYSRRALACVYVGLGEPLKAIQQLDALLLRSPDDLDALARRCEAYLEAGDVASARSDFETLRRRTAGARLGRLQVRLETALAGRGRRRATTSDPLPR
jgi:tetratricopeptide (TPR) repeat protein